MKDIGNLMYLLSVGFFIKVFFELVKKYSKQEYENPHNKTNNKTLITLSILGCLFLLLGRFL